MPLPNELPAWIRALDGDDSPEVMLGVRNRELTLPPHLRAKGVARRELRDAMLARKMLHPVLTPANPVALRDLAMYAQRENTRSHMNAAVERFSASMDAESVDWCQEAAKELFSMMAKEGRQGRGRA